MRAAALPVSAEKSQKHSELMRSLARRLSVFQMFPLAFNAVLVPTLSQMQRERRTGIGGREWTCVASTDDCIFTGGSVRTKATIATSTSLVRNLLFLFDI
jgi:hypothetical protein